MSDRLPRAALVAIVSTAVAALACGLAAAQEAPAPTPVWSLEECIRAALTHDPDIASSEAAISAALASRRITRSEQDPQLSLDASVGLGSRTRTSGSAVTVGTASSALALEWTFWRTGRSAAFHQSDAEVDVALRDHDALLQSVVEEVATRYYARLASEELIGVAREGVISAEAHLHDVQRRIDVGKAAEVDLFPARSDLAQARLDLIDAQSSARSAQAQLRNSLGLDFHNEFTLAQPEEDPQRALPSLEDAIALAREARPDLSASASSVQARVWALDAARKARRPSATLGSTAAWDPLSSPASSRWAITARVTWPIFDGHASRAAEDRAGASLRQAEASERRVGLSVELEVEEALIELGRARERMVAAEEAATSARKQWEAATARYRREVGIPLEVTDARKAYTQAAAELVRARFDEKAATVTLQRAMGSLVVPTAGEGAP